MVSAFLGLLLGCPVWLAGQASQDPAPAAPQKVYPDQGYLSSTRYVNCYFGFSFDLPPAAQLEPVPQPASRDGRVQILQLGGPPPGYATVSIVAFPVRGKMSLDAKATLRRALDQELFRGVEELHGVSKTKLAGRQFYFYETRRGADQHMALAADLEGYVLVATVGASKESTVKLVESSVQNLVFFPAAKAREYAGAAAQEYEGPAISSHRLADLQANPPAKRIDAGHFQGTLYENQSLGFRYRIPAGWTLEEEGAVEPAIERSRRSTYEDPWLGAGERELMKVCGRTLLSAWAKRPDANGQLSYDDFGEVTVSAASMACFPGSRFPTTSTDRRAVEDFLLQLRLTHPILQSMRDAKAFTAGGGVVIYLHGTVAFTVPDDALSRRLSIAMAVTSRRGYLLTWFLAAPHDGELKELMEEKIAFDAEPPVKEASAAKPGGGNIAVESPNAVPVAATPESHADGEPAKDVTPQPESSQANAGNTPLADSGKPQDAADATSSSHPSLLRPGENTQEQMGRGKSAPPK